MKNWLVAYIKDNFHDLLQADIKMARLLGAPQGYTLSGNAYRLEKAGKPWGKFWRPIIDKIFKWLWNQETHCADAYREDMTRGKLP